MGRYMYAHSQNSARVWSIGTYCTAVKPLNSRHIGGKAIVHCREVVPISEVGWPAMLLNPMVVDVF